MTDTAVTHLECSRTGERFAAGTVHNVSTAGWPLLVRYDLETLKQRWDRDSLADAPRSMWRYAPLLPVRLKNTSSRYRRGLLRCIESIAWAITCNAMTSGLKTKA